jgi:hypothetical protein
VITPDVHSQLDAMSNTHCNMSTGMAAISLWLFFLGCLWCEAYSCRLTFPVRRPHRKNSVVLNVGTFLARGFWDNPVSNVYFPTWSIVSCCVWTPGVTTFITLCSSAGTEVWYLPHLVARHRCINNGSVAESLGPLVRGCWSVFVICLLCQKC